jgi:hypothetical protein
MINVHPNFLSGGGMAALQPMTYTELDRLGLQTGQLHHPASDAIIAL